jgi:hypothetical protein
MKPLLRWLPGLLPGLLLAASPVGPSARSLPPLVLPHGVGVNIHFTRGHERDLDLIAAAGFRFVRMDFVWSSTERRCGEYDWSAYEELTEQLEQRGLRALYILDYSNPLYEDTVVARNPITGREERTTASPQQPQSVAAFARWAAAAAAHFRGRGVLWEIWNEPNIGFWRPRPDVRQYATLALATCRAVRAADPEAGLLAPASSGFPWEFIEGLFRSGVLEYLDGVSVHPYRGYSQGPETVAADYRRLRALIERHAPPARRFLPIVSGEWGYATHTEGGVTLEIQAAFLVRQQLVNLLHGVPLSIWYDWKNDGPDANYHEHNFGTVTPTLEPKPSYRAVQTLTRELPGYRIARRLETGQADAYVLLLTNAKGDQKLVAWSAVGSRTVELPLGDLTADTVRLVDGLGERRAFEGALQSTAQASRWNLGPLPQYLTLRSPRRDLAAAAAWQLGPTPALIEAGGSAALSVPVKVTNPFPQPLAVKASLLGLDPIRRPTIEGKLDPGESRTWLLPARVDQRWPAEIEAQIRVELTLEDSGNQRAWSGTWDEPRHFTLTNPFELQLAPLAGGYRLQLRNPARGPFQGRVRLADVERDLRLTEAQPEVTVEVKSELHRVAVQVLDAQGQTVVQTPSWTFLPLDPGPLDAVLDGDGQVAAQARLAVTNAPGGDTAPYPMASRLDYEFGAGWRFVRVAPTAPAGSILLEFPEALGLWVHGDQSGNVLRLRVTDEANQTFQPDGPRLDWTGWRWVEFDLKNLKSGGHWGGANDGVPRGWLRLDTLLLVDSTREPTSGTLHFAGPVLLRRGP